MWLVKRGLVGPREVPLLLPSRDDLHKLLSTCELQATRYKLGAVVVPAGDQRGSCRWKDWQNVSDQR